VSLSKYKLKRDFSKTPEPPARVSKHHSQPLFVIQEHHASRLHYDFRLEADGVLKSWAVPKQPTLDPSAKRLAVHVEDHPLQYANFSGQIPKGEYGAGKVRIWDKGTYENLLAKKPRPQTVVEGIKKGHVEVALHGRKLKGKFALVRMNGSGRDNWLLIKMRDEEARAETKRKPRTKSESADHASRLSSSKPARTPRTSSTQPSSPIEEIKLTNLDKVMFPKLGITKGDVLQFYERIADRLLPHLRDRPITLERLPDGLARKDAPHFWQKDTPSYYPSWIPRIEIASEDGKKVHYALVNNVETLLYMVNQGTITFHPWFSRIPTLDKPDFVLFDLDPGNASFDDVVRIARKLQFVLREEEANPFLKTSGKSGLHVLVPWQQEGGYDEARAWAMEIAQRVVAELPDIATIERSKSKRAGKVYVDVMQNVRGHHAVPPYVLRPVPPAAVSTPLHWRELTPNLDPQKFNLKTIFRRLARQKSDPFAALVRFYNRAKR
jgi:bifunctional non-homologous end joining protein LigD